MALSGDLRKRVVEAVVSGGLSRNSAAKRFEVGIASAVRWVKQFEATGEMSPKPLQVIAALAASKPITITSWG